MTTDQAVAAALARHQGAEGPLLPILHDVQAALGFVSASAVQQIAQALNLSRAEVHGIVTFYHRFRNEPPVAPLLQVCRAESCRSMGSEALWDCARSLPECQPEAVYCLGLCAQSPAAMLGDKPLARLTPEKLKASVKA